MNRSGFLKMFAALPAAALSLGGTPPRGYQRTQPRIGRIDAHGEFSAIAPGDVEKVTVNGVEVDHVFQLDDVEGWVRRYRYADGTEDGFADDGAPIERIEGEVEVWWRAGGARVRSSREAHHEVNVTAEPGTTGKDLWDAFEKEARRQARASGSNPFDSPGEAP